MADSRIDTRVIYQHPLAYLLGLEGIALLRAFSGVYDHDFTLARLREIQTLLDSAEKLGDGVEARPITEREGYDRWAPFYDEPGNQLLEIAAGPAATPRTWSLGHKVIGGTPRPRCLPALARRCWE